MSAKRIAALIPVALLATTLLLSGCVKPPVTPATTTPSTTVPTQATEPTQTSVEPTATSPIDATGPITKPASGSAERKALLDAARDKLGTSTQFYVYQLYAQGDTALGDLEPLDNNSTGRIFVAWERKGGEWVAIGVTKFGSKAAGAASTARALPSFSEELIGKIDWKMAKPDTGDSSSSSSSMKATLSTAAKGWAKSQMEGVGSPYKVTLVKVAKDSKGTWWGRVTVQPSPDEGNNYEQLSYWAKYSGGEWTSKALDPEPPAPSTYFPSSVISKLGL